VAPVEPPENIPVSEAAVLVVLGRREMASWEKPNNERAFITAF
jgi:hypothetical protein